MLENKSVKRVSLIQFLLNLLTDFSNSIEESIDINSMIFDNKVSLITQETS